MMDAYLLMVGYVYGHVKLCHCYGFTWLISMIMHDGMCVCVYV